MEKSIKRRLGVLVVLGIFAAIMLAQPVATVTVNPTNIIMQDDEWIGSSVSTEALIRFDLSTTPNQFEILQADVGIYDEDPDFRLEVAGSSGDGYFGVSTDDTTDGDIFIIDSSGNVGIGTTSPQGALDVVSTTGGFIVPRMTTAQRNALTAVNGMIIYNTDTPAFNFYENGAWVTGSGLT